MNSGDIVTVITSNGMEYVGKLGSAGVSDIVTLEDPRMIVANEQGMGFANGIAMTGMKDPKKVVFRNFIFVTETNDEVISAWRQATTGLITKPEKGIIGV
jgi:hypothetical protein